MNSFISTLTDAQMDQVIVLIGDGIKSIGAAIRTVWDTLSPVMLAYILWRQALNRKVLESKIEEKSKVLEIKIDENTKVTTDALVVAQTIAEEVHVTPVNPVKTDQI